MFSEKMHNVMRKLQLIFTALSGSLGILAAAIDLGKVGVIVAAILAACGYFVGQLAENDSAVYFDKKTIIDKVVEDQEPEVP